MHGAFGNSEAVATEIGGHFRPGTDKIVRPLFGPVARAIWPLNTEAHVAAVAQCDVRTARRWLSGEYDAPAIVYAHIWMLIVTSRKP
jgi:hypothetical protein